MARGMIVLAFALIALAFTLLAPEAHFSRETLAPPSGGHWLGTDNVGRDVHLLAWRAAGSSIVGVFCALLCSLFIGVIAGIVMSVSLSPWITRPLSWFAAILDSVGVLLPAIAFLSVYPRVTVMAMGGLLGMLAWPSIAFPLARLVVSLQSEPYVIAGRAMGGDVIHQLRCHLLEPCLRILVPLCASLASGFLAILASLQFLGAFSASELTIGSLLYEATTMIRQAPWCVAGGIFSFGISILIVNGVAYGIVRSNFRNNRCAPS